MRRKTTKQKWDEIREKDFVYYDLINYTIDSIFDYWADYHSDMTIKELAEKSGVRAATIRKLCNFETLRPQFRTVVLIAHALGLSLEIAPKMITINRLGGITNDMINRGEAG